SVSCYTTPSLPWLAAAFARASFSLISSSLYFSSPLDRSDRDSVICLKEFDGGLLTEPGHWLGGGGRGKGAEETRTRTPAYRTLWRDWQAPGLGANMPGSQ